MPLTNKVSSSSSLPHANPMEQSPNQLPQNMPILKYTRQREIEILSDAIYIHQPMLPAKCYCFAVAKTNAAMRLERLKNEINIVNKLHGVGSGRRRFQMRNCCVYKLNAVFSVGTFFTAESLIEHCQVIRSVNSAM